MPTVLVTGANRGLGLEFVRSFAADGWRVHACARNVEKAKTVRGLEGDVVCHKLDVTKTVRGLEGDVVCHKLDVTNGLKVASLARSMTEEPIDLLINNAGQRGPKTGFGDTDFEEWANVLQVNTLAPLRMVERFAALIERSERKLVVNISSILGSIARSSGDDYVYRSSKAALNMVTKTLACDLEGRGVTVVCFHPGWVRTDMGGGSADITPQESVAGMRQVIDGLGTADSGKFFNYDGTPLEW